MVYISLPKFEPNDLLDIRAGDERAKKDIQQHRVQFQLP